MAEAEFAQSKDDFISKISIALKEANETKYWLEILCETEIITKEQANGLLIDCSEIINILVTALKTLKNVN